MASCRLSDFHSDPADHIIVATTIILGIPLITDDQEITSWNEVRRLLQVMTL